MLGLQRFLTRSFSTSLSARANRAIVFADHGDPTNVLSCLTYPSLPHPPPNTLNVKFILAPINPADINLIEGSYPSKLESSTSLNTSGPGSQHQPVFIGGNEGLAEVLDIGSGVAESNGLRKGDWVIMIKQQAGTWASCRNVAAADVLQVPKHNHKGFTLSEVNAATLTVNPPTAYNMLRDFVHLKEHDWVVQNGANSAVGQAVIQIAASRGIKTINFVRSRDPESLRSLTHRLTRLGATHVTTYDDLQDKNFRKQVKEWTGGKDIRLALNCVGGVETAQMARLLGHDAHLVSYGAMSKQPLSLPTSLFIFKNLTCHGYWQSRWYEKKSREEREKLMGTLVDLMTAGKLQEPEHEIVTISEANDDNTATSKIREIITQVNGGRYGKKVLLRIEETMD